MAQERLQKILARAGVSSRRAAETLITKGEVSVNGKVVTELGARADLENDRIAVSGKPIGREQHVYFLAHKPRGMVTTLSDPEGRPNLSELLKEIPERVYPIGRLDFHTSGALLLTNDGDLAQALLHPSKEVPKTYIVKLNIEADDRMVYALRSGVTLDDGYRTREASVVPLRVEDGKGWLEITITEGKNRQIHRMIEAVGARVMRLARQTFAGISSEGVRPGRIRPLEPHEVAMLLRRYVGRSTEERSDRKKESQERIGRSDRRDPRQTRPAQEPKASVAPAKGRERPAARGRDERPAARGRDERPARDASAKRAIRTEREPRSVERPARALAPRADRAAVREERPAPRAKRPERAAQVNERPARAQSKREPNRAERPAERPAARRNEREPAQAERPARAAPRKAAPRKGEGLAPARALAAKLGVKTAETARTQPRKAQDTFDSRRGARHKKRT